MTGLMFETKGKAGKMWRSSARRGGPRCDACGADCGAWTLLLAHLRKKTIREHANRHQVLDEQRERVEEVIENLHRPAHRNVA